MLVCLYFAKYRLHNAQLGKNRHLHAGPCYKTPRQDDKRFDDFSVLFFLLFVR